MCTYARKTITAKPFGPILTQAAIAIMDRRVGITRCAMVLAAYIILPLRILVFIQSFVWISVRARVRHIIARPVRANSVARVRSLLDRYVRICAVPRYVRASYSHVFETIVRALELSISERLDSVPSTSTTVMHTPVRGGEEISSRDVFPVSANPSRGGIRKRGGVRARGAKGVAEIYLTRISRVRARYRDCLARARLTSARET